MGAAVIGFVVVVIMLLLLGSMAALLAGGWQRLTTPKRSAEDEGRVEMTERGAGRAPLLDLERERPGSTLRRFFREIFGAGNAELRDAPQTGEADATIDADGTLPLPVLPQDFTQMSGTEFEHYMAGVFEEQGYDATVLGGAGDQGVDLLLRKGNEFVAVQCKNYGQRIGNQPVQEVFAGARHHGVQQAWVVAPAGFTR
jgi:hypothetical protein